MILGNSLSFVRRALIAVYNKKPVIELCHFLQKNGVELLATTGVVRALRQENIIAKDVSELTGLPQILGDRVKTLHHLIHGGILADRSSAEHMEDVVKHGLQLIDLVVVGLYPFADDPSVGLIDVGGPTMIRVAAKNFSNVCVVTQEADYSKLVDELKSNNMATSLEFRKIMARKAFSLTAEYDALIANSAVFNTTDGNTLNDNDESASDDLPDNINLTYKKACSLRYGENPGQKGAFYTKDGLPNFKQLQGKHLSYNNIMDAGAALALVSDFVRPTIAIIKHNTPCAVASGDNINTAYNKAIEADKISAFGGIIGSNRPIDGLTAGAILGLFTEVVIAPDFTPDALEAFSMKPNIRLLVCDPMALVLDIRSVFGGLLIQEHNNTSIMADDLRLVNGTQEGWLQDALFAYKVCKHVNSNAIVVAREEVTVGIGCGQTNRVDSVRIALRGQCKGAVLASDGFFPFADSINEASIAGIGCIVQPGGSINDALVIDAAHKTGITMFFTDKRCFKH